VRFALPKPKSAGNVIKGVVLRIDSFGNLMTNFTPKDVPALAAPDGKFAIAVGNAQINKVFPTFAQGPPGEPIGVIGSSGYLEISINKGNAARTLAVSRGAEVTLTLG